MRTYNTCKKRSDFWYFPLYQHNSATLAWYRYWGYTKPFVSTNSWLGRNSKLFARLAVLCAKFEASVKMMHAKWINFWPHSSEKDCKSSSRAPKTRAGKKSVRGLHFLECKKMHQKFAFIFSNRSKSLGSYECNTWHVQTKKTKLHHVPKSSAQKNDLLGASPARK